ncbi:MAG: methyltransferase domain-containing protein [Deltaproteobacteria bacterium]|nr:methyltransferase domain-containing protein [Deltaproteobacteria bacterium]
MATFTYQESDVHRRYDLGRALMSDATDGLMALLRGYVARPVNLIVDLGCGTGRFSSALSEAFAAQVLGVEPADNMRATAEAKPRPPSVRFVQGDADCIPIDDSVADLLFMSQVLHHLTDAPKALREIRRVLKSKGNLCVRQTTRENLDSYFYQRFFPAARAVDERRLLFRGRLVGLVTSCQFRTVAIETLRYEVAPSATEYVEKIALRTYSDLECIDDSAFHQGLNEFRAHCSAHPDLPRLAENDLFVFEKE